MEEVKINPQIMEEYTFSALIISGHRVTIRDDIFEDLNLRKGEKVRITIRKVKKQLTGVTMEI